jgi:hypothetical protein
VQEVHNLRGDLGGFESISRAIPAGYRCEGAVQRVRDDGHVDVRAHQPFLDSLLEELCQILVDQANIA